MRKKLLTPRAGSSGIARRLSMGRKIRAIAAGLLVAGGLIYAGSAQAQNTILSEGFESGVNGWTIVNGIQPNKWFVGSVTSASGTQSMYIDNGTGATNVYTITTSSIAHFYKEVVFPANQKNLQLTFKWKAQGEGTSSNDWDNLKVFITSASTPIVAGSSMPIADQIGASFYNFSPAGAYTTTTINLPSSLAGTTKRLVFSWKNDESAGTQPPVSVDDIVITSLNATSLSGVYTINNTLPTGGTNFTSFGDAITTLNTEGFTGPITFNVSAGQTFIENAPVITASGSVANPIVFQKSGTGANPVLKPTGTTSTTDGGLVIAGGDYFTFDGIDISINTGSALEYGYLIRNATFNDGAMNNTIKNAKITLNKANTSSIGIIQTSGTTGGGIIPVATSGTNQNNIYTNIIIENSYNGILLSSGSGTFPDNNNQVFNNTIGGATSGDMGGGSTAAYGIKATLQSNAKIFGNEVRSTVVTAALADGIFIDQAIGLVEVYRNNVHAFRNTGTGSTSAITGLRLNTYVTTAGNVIRAYNNLVYDITHAFTGTATGSRRIIGIIVQSNGTGANNTINVDFNTVRIESPSTFTASSAVFEIGTTSGPVINVRNNIFSDFTGSQTGLAKHYVWITTSSSLTGIAGSVSNYNLLYVANLTNGFIGLTNATDRITLGNWQGATTQDYNSKSSNPQFISATDLHINPSTPTEVEGSGSYLNGAITWVTTDFDNDVRNATTPDLGADEGAFTPADLTGPTITYSPFLKTSLLTNRTLTVTITDPSGVPTTGTLAPRIYFSKTLVLANFSSTQGVLTSGTATNGTWTFTVDNSLLGGVAAGDLIYYFVVAQDANGNLGSNPGGAVGTNVNNITGGLVLNYSIVGAVPTVITVPGTYPSLTLAGGLFAAINAGVLTGNTEVRITGDLSGETGANLLNQWTEDGVGNYTLTISPDAAINRTISGTSTASSGIIRLNGADRVTIDGSFNGSGNYLTLLDNNTASSSWAIVLNGAANNNTIRNLNIRSASNTTTSIYGIISTSGTNNNLLIENNIITRAYMGILVVNDVNAQATGVIIRNNTIGSNTATDYVANRGLVLQNLNGPIITGNTIFNLQTALTGNLAGIEVGTTVSNAMISQNKIYGLRSTNASFYGVFGIYISSVAGTTNNTIQNNMISDLQTVGQEATMQNPFGIRLDGGINTKIYYNSINLTGALTGTGAMRSAGLLVNNNTITGLDVRNNIFANSMTGTATTSSYAIYGVSGTTFGTINNNDYFVSGPAGKLGFLASDLSTLAEWKSATGQDANSISVDPQFVSATDLHIASGNTALDNMGTPIAGVTIDFDNQTRNSVRPDIGADEFGPLALPTVTAGGPTTFCNGGSVLLTAASTQPGVTYQWQLNGAPITGATSATFTANASGNYTVVTTEGGNSSTSAATTVTANPIPATPTITAGGSTTFCAGGSVTLTASSATSGATYQWLQNGTPISGATSATFAATTSGTYTALALSGTCSSPASTATVVTANSGAATPTITAGGPTSFCTGGSVVLTAASTTTGVSYTWYLNGNLISGANLATYTANASGNYTAVAAASGCPSFASAPTAVTVTTIPTTPTITAGGATTFCSGGSVTLTAASSTGATFQWKLNGTNITGATNATYAANAAGAYTVVASSGTCSSPVSATTTVTVNTTPATPTLTAGGPVSFCSGGSVSLTAASATSGVTYQWLLNGTPISGATSATYAATTAGNYTAIATLGTCSSVASAATAVTVNAIPATPTITAGGATTFCTGGSVVLTGASTTTGVTYQWLLNGTAITGATSATYTANAAGNYTVRVSGAGSCTSTSAQTTVTVTSAAAVPTLAAGGPVSFCTGGSVTLTATSATTGATYTWFLNGSPIAGATSATYTANAAGNYTAVATATGCPSAASAATAVTVNAPAALPTIAAGGPTTFCAGGSVALTAASTTTGATYTWFLNGTPITGATSATYTANAAGNYTAVATANGCPSAASAGTTVTVNALPATPTIAQNGGILTSSAATGNQWYLNGILIPGATGQNYTTAANGAYTVITTGTNGCASTASAVKNVTNTGLNAALAEMGIQVYPNPNNGSFNVKLTGYQKDATITLYNLAGQLIATETVKAANTDQNVKAMNLKGLAAGTYLLKVMSDKGTQVTRLVVE